jgi:C1A family cysteine protease
MRALILVAMVLSLSACKPQAAEASQKKHKSYKTKKYAQKHAMGLKKSDKKTLQTLRHISFLGAATPVPGGVDLSQKVSPPENQGNCGSCWDFSLTKALRSEFMLKGMDPGQLEFNYLLNNCGSGPRMYGCNGGDFVAAKSLLNLEGPGLNALNPYVQKQSKKCSNQPVKATAVSYAMLGKGAEGPTFKDLAYAVGVERHMLSIDVAAGAGDWADYADGIFDDCVDGQVDHMINLVGYSCESSVDSQGNCLFDTKGKPVHGDGYLIVQNNWSEDWGIKGYMRTRMYSKRGTKCNAIASDALMFQVNSPKPPEPSPSVSPAPTPSKPCSGFLCGELGCWLPWCHKSE